MVRLKTNLILDGKLHKSGTIIDEELLPPHLRDHVQDLDRNEEAAVLVLRDLNFPNTTPAGFQWNPDQLPCPNRGW
jgi:hypothetical protein